VRTLVPPLLRATAVAAEAAPDLLPGCALGGGIEAPVLLLMSVVPLTAAAAAPDFRSLLTAVPADRAAAPGATLTPSLLPAAAPDLRLPRSCTLKRCHDHP